MNYLNLEYNHPNYADLGFTKEEMNQILCDIIDVVQEHQFTTTEYPDMGEKEWNEANAQLMCRMYKIFEHYTIAIQER